MLRRETCGTQIDVITLTVRLWRCALSALGLVAFTALGQPLVVHEWGTFTSLQDETGRTVAGINSDDEPVPAFCHDVAWRLIQRPSALPPILAKGVALCHPEVTMRLETPVIYFHPPPGVTLPMQTTVKVAFRGGWLTQFYPAAEIGGFSPEAHLNDATRGTLAWNGLTLGGTGTGPETTERVWTAPRAVQTATLTATNGESEKFLFYRGVGHLDCPLRVKRTADSTRLEGTAQGDCATFGSPLVLQRLWLASFRPDGGCAFRPLPAVTLNRAPGSASPPPLFSTAATFTPDEYSQAKVAALRDQMRAALENEGLFADEAEGLLNTWETSYFKSAGLRLFFLVPREWTDAVLPLEVSVPCETKRVMVGRLELVTPEQRALLRQLAGASVPRLNWAGAPAQVDPSHSGGMPAAYRDLGRFRNALLLDENRAHPSRALDAFIRLNGLQSLASSSP